MARRPLERLESGEDTAKASSAAPDSREGGPALAPAAAACRSLKLSKHVHFFPSSPTFNQTTPTKQQFSDHDIIQARSAMANQTHIAADSSTSGWEPTVQDQINLSLATNGGIKRIEAVMQQRLDEAGWTQSLKEYVTKLLRSGEASTYDECLAKVMAAVNGKEGVNGVNGAGGAGQAPNLKMPDDAMQDAAAAVKKEIAPLLVEKK